MLDGASLADVRFRPVPRRYARRHLEHPLLLSALIGWNVAGVLVGVDYYLPTMPEVSPLLWPFHLDSPGALFLMAASLLTLVPNLGRPLEAAPQNRALAALHTLAFVWLVKYGLWTAIALNLRPGAYFPALWAYWGILATHLLFPVEAYLIPHYGRTTRGALAAALALLLANDLLDYGLGIHPPLRYPPDLVLPAVSVALSVLAVVAAAASFDRLEDR